MREWRVPFHVIENEWTDWQYFSMLDRLNERKQAEEKAMKKAQAKSKAKRGRRRR